MQRSSAGKGAGQRAARGDSPLSVTGTALSKETQPDPYCYEQGNTADPFLCIVCGGLAPLSREGTLIKDILRDLQRQVIAWLIVN